ARPPAALAGWRGPRPVYALAAGSNRRPALPDQRIASGTARSGRRVMYALALAAALAAAPMEDLPAPATVSEPSTLPTVQATQYIPGIDEVLEIPPGLRAMLQERVIAPGGNREKRLERLAAMVLEADGLALAYDNDRTRTVAETFRDRRGNRSEEHTSELQ